jgi:1-acyl-sn-glycerol-3-phosphate acyltransferase
MKMIFKRNFAPLFWTQFLGAFNDNVFKNALVLLITYRSVSVWGLDAQSVVALSGALFILPFFLFSPFAGELADRMDRVRLAQITKIFEMIIMLTAAIGLWFENFAFLLVALFIMGAQSSLFGPLKYGMLPDTVGDEKLAAANAYTSAGTFVAILLGTMLGGVLVASNSLTWLAISLIAFAVLGWITSLQLHKIPIHPDASRQSLHGSFARVWKLSYQDRQLFSFILSISWFWFLGAIILSMMAPLAKDVLFGDEWVSTFFLVLFTLGMGLGAAVANRIHSSSADIGLSPIMGLMISLTLWALALSIQDVPDPGSLLGLADFLTTLDGVATSFIFLSLSIASGAYIVPLMTALQFHTPKEKLSRIIAGLNIWNSLFMVLGSVLLMLAYGVSLSMDQIFLILAVVNFFVQMAVYATCSPYALRLWAIVLTKIFFRVEMKGRQHFPLNGPFIIAANHVSFLDWLLVMAACPHPVRFVIDHQYYYAPFMPFWLRQARLIPIATKRDRPDLMESALQEVSHALRKNEVIGLFPEGALSRTGQLRRFQPGLLRILKEDPVPVVAMSLKGLWGSPFSHSAPGLFKKWPRWKFRKVTLTIHAPLTQEFKDLRGLEELIQTGL